MLRPHRIVLITPPEPRMSTTTPPYAWTCDPCAARRLVVALDVTPDEFHEALASRLGYRSSGSNSMWRRPAITSSATSVSIRPLTNAVARSRRNA